MGLGPGTEASKASSAAAWQAAIKNDSEGNLPQMIKDSAASGSEMAMILDYLAQLSANVNKILTAMAEIKADSDFDAAGRRVNEIITDFDKGLITRKDAEKVRDRASKAVRDHDAVRGIGRI